MEIVSSIVGSIAENISSRLFDAGGRQIGYLLNSSDNIEALRKQAQKLEATRGTIQVRIDAAERNREIILPDVKNWISEVDNVSVQAEKFLEDEVNANKRCFKGWCIDLRSRYRFSKAAKQKVVVIIQLQDDGKFQTVSQPAPPPQGIIFPAVGFSGIFESRESIKNEIMEALKDDKVSIVGICGMGSVGKTTLVKKIAKHAKEEKMYDLVVMVVVSQTPSIVNIQKEIAYRLGLTSLSNSPKSARASLLWERIEKEKRILIILDDLWERIQLEEIGIPFGKDHGGCKIVLTSRSKNVCDQMDCDKTSIVGTLSKQESWALFKELVGMDVENSIISPIAREVAAECDGLPIAIVTIARALKNKDKHVWIDVARQLKTSTPTDIPGLQGSVISSLELSIKYLENEDAKSLFFFCSSFPEDFRISIEVLVRYGAGLRWLKNVDTMDHVRHRGHAIVSSLIFSFLLIHEKDDYDDKEYIKMHDVVGDVAHIIAPKFNQIFLVKAGIGLEQWPERDTFESLTCISLMSNNIKVVPNGIECPKLQSLLLQKNLKLVLPNNFFQGMKDLRVLDLSGTLIRSPLPSSLSLLVNLRTQYLNDCYLDELSIIGHLRNLEILSLCGSKISEIPISFSQLIHLRLLDLNNYIELTQIADGVISALCKLEELYNLRHPRSAAFEDQWHWTRSATLTELQYLSRLTSLKIFIPNQDLLPDNDMPFKKLSSFTIIIGAENNMEDFLRTKRYYSRKIMISANEVTILRLVNCLNHLVTRKTECLFICGLQNIFLDLVDTGLNELKSLTVTHQDVTYLLNMLERESKLTFQNLEELEIRDHPNLVEICHESFKVHNCEAVVYIFDCEELKVANGETKLLSSLKDLDLYHLPEMTHIWKGDTQYIDLCNLNRISVQRCPKLIKLFSPVLLRSLISLEEIEIIYCENLEEIFIFGMKEEEEYEERGIVPWRKDHTTTSLSLGNLTSIGITDCSKLKNLFTPSIVKSLVNLRQLEIASCSTLHEIITNEEASAVQRIVFPSLSSLLIRWLDNIACFSSDPYSIEFPVLETLRIYRCPNMKIFGYGEQLTPKLNKVLIDGYGEEERWMGDLNSTVQQLCLEEEMEKNKKQDAEKSSGLPENMDPYHNHNIYSLLRFMSENCDGRFMGKQSIEWYVKYWKQITKHRMFKTLRTDHDDLVLKMKQQNDISANKRTTCNDVPVKRKKEGEEKRMTQEEMLLEAAQTEFMKLRNLECNLVGEEEVKKRALVHKAVYGGPQIRYLSNDDYSYLEFSKGASSQSEISTTSVPYPGKAVCAVTELPARLWDCKNLEEIFIFGTKEEEEYEEKGIAPWRKDHTTTSPSLGNLTSIDIMSSSKVKNLFSPSLVNRLVKLRSLCIVGCSTLHEIITNEETSAIQRIVFPSLSSLRLGGLDNIVYFSSGSYSIEFPALESLWIYECPNMKIFGYGEQLTPKLNKVIIDYHDKEERWRGNLNSTLQQLFI
ncbi:disease resistance protein SUMM2-like [Pistacia vera]|uniref:disease resistance protein SUMM2-like n=1 Tax=Pistacia vera TaxID=55513 RepID=UPI001263C218|nr:disease resistance protein SUMM2-like [Pistacia vera]